MREGVQYLGISRTATDHSGALFICILPRQRLRHCQRSRRSGARVVVKSGTRNYSFGLRTFFGQTHHLLGLAVITPIVVSCFTNRTPARSRAVRISAIARSETSRLDFSKSTIVERPSPERSASCCTGYSQWRCRFAAVRESLYSPRVVPCEQGKEQRKIKNLL